MNKKGKSHTARWFCFAKGSILHSFAYVALYLAEQHIYLFTSLATSLAKEVMFLVALVCLFVCLSACGQHYSQSYKRIGMKFYGGVLGSTIKN